MEQDEGIADQQNTGKQGKNDSINITQPHPTHLSPLKICRVGMYTVFNVF